MLLCCRSWWRYRHVVEGSVGYDAVRSDVVCVLSGTDVGIDVFKDNDVAMIALVYVLFAALCNW